MSKEIDVVGENGEITKETVYSADEFKAANTDLEKTKADLAELQRINATRGEDFKAYSKMTEEEKKVFDANTTNLLKNEEKLVNKIGELETKLTEKEKRDNDASKTSILTSIHHGNEEAKKILEDKYALLSAMPETTPQEIQARSMEAAKLAGIQIDPRNPIYTAISGDAPHYKETKDYVETAEGMQAAEMARAALGLPSQVKK